jgi:xanthine dehydrogenase YagS FAD-binding subunit
MSRALAGGTNLVDLMKYDVARPARLVDINRLPLKTDRDRGRGVCASAPWLRIRSRMASGRSEALANAVERHCLPGRRRSCATLRQRAVIYCSGHGAIIFMIRRPHATSVEPGSGCSAIGGVNRIHAILGASDKCIAVHPSDMCVALAALDASVEVEGAGKRSIPMSAFHRLAGR